MAGAPGNGAPVFFCGRLENNPCEETFSVSELSRVAAFWATAP
jgi:hypothetical protein